jgi:hypothetical protein
VPQPLSADTSAEAAEVQFAVWRAMSPAEKLALVGSLSEMALRLEREGIRMRNPSMSEEEIRRAVLVKRVGPELAAKVLGDDR